MVPPQLLRAVNRACVWLPARFGSSSSSHLSENHYQRLLLATAYRSLDAYGLNEGICNHLSALAPARNDPNKKVMLLIPYGLLWKEVTPDNLVGLDENNVVVEGEGEPEVSASCIHRGVYQARGDIKSVMHTHMPYGTAIACLKEPRLLMVQQSSTLFYDRLVVDTAYGGIVTAIEEGQRIGGLIKDKRKNVLHMGHHGVLTIGHSVPTAFDLMYYFERACMFQVLAMSTGLPVAEMPLEVARESNKAWWNSMDITADAHLKAHLRLLSKTNSEFRH